MDNPDATFILGSRSPRRLELLRQLVPATRLEVVSPRSAAEAGFEGLLELPAIHSRLREIARAKCQDVLEQLSAERRWHIKAVIAADTTIVVSDSHGGLVVLSQPPADDSWQDVVRHWFRAYYAARPHFALTGLCVSDSEGRITERVVQSEVTFHSDCNRWIEWYIATGEPRGKAGGYALQGAGSLFVSQVKGSLSNVIGLPLRELKEIFEELGIDAG